MSVENSEMIPSILDTPKAPIESEVRSRLAEYARQEMILDFFELSLVSLHQLRLSEYLFCIFSGWKLGRLAELEPLDEGHFPQMSSSEFEIASEFLRAHRLRTQGQIKEGFHILEQLRDQTPEWVVLYRYAAESTAFYNLDKAAKEIESLRLQLPPWAQSVLAFNLGVLALNRGQIGLYFSIEKRFQTANDSISLFFLNWMQGGYYQQLENSQKSVEHYLHAMDLIEDLPSRKTDLPILAFLTLQQSVWAGDMKASRHSWAIIEKLAHSKNTLSPESHSLAKAIYELNEGNLREATLRFERLFENTQWNKDHLRGGELFFWVLITRKESQRGQRLVRLLSEVREQIGFSAENSLLPIYQYYFDFLNQEISLTDLQKKLLRQNDLYQITGIDKGKRICEFLGCLVDEDPQVKATAFDAVKQIPFLQRIGIALLSEQRLIPAALRSIKIVLTDAVARLMLDLHLSRLTEDLGLFAQTMVRLGQQKVIPWGALLNLSNSAMTMDFGRSLLNSELLVDGEAHRVIAIESLENLDNQPLLAELALSLFRNPGGLSKEMAALGIGYSTYDPIQHDPIIYNLISRLRDWLRKQGLSIHICSGRQGWYFTNREMIQGYFLDDPWIMRPQTEGPVVVSHRSLPPRLEWILAVIEKKGFIDRAEFMSRFQIKKSTAANDFNKLIAMNLIIRQGQGRGIYYVLKENSL